jgi:hypothetical protein
MSLHVSTESDNLKATKPLVESYVPLDNSNKYVDSP